eukprot:157390_1
MSTKAQRKYTRSGFPKPYEKDEYNHDEVVWVFIRKDLPYWPAQIKTGGTIFSSKKQKTTKGLRKITVVTFNDPDHSVVIQTPENIMNDTTKHPKRKKDTHKTRTMDRKCLLHWEAKTKKNDPIDYDHVLNEYTKRMKLSGVDDIDESIFKEWNDIALDQAEKELGRLFDVQRYNVTRKEEEEKQQKALEEEEERKESMKGEIYDGRINGQGWILEVGDRISYYPENQLRNSNKPITTTIIHLRDKYGTTRLQCTAPVGVECDGAPPFWETEIQKLPAEDDMNPIFYPLKQCMFVPGEMDNKIDQELFKVRKKFNKKMKKAGWGSMMHNSMDTEANDTTTHNKQKQQKKQKHPSSGSGKKKRNRKRKRRLCDSDTTDSDVVILNNNTNNASTPSRNIRNNKEDVQFSFDKRTTRRGTKSKTSDKTREESKDTNANPPRKKRRLNARRASGTRDMPVIIEGSPIEVEEEIDNNDCNDKMNVDSEDEPILPSECIPFPPETKKMECDDTTDTSPKKSKRRLRSNAKQTTKKKCTKQKQSPKQKRKRKKTEKGKMSDIASLKKNNSNGKSTTKRFLDDLMDKKPPTRKGNKKKKKQQKKGKKGDDAKKDDTNCDDDSDDIWNDLFAFGKTLK